MAHRPDRKPSNASGSPIGAKPVSLATHDLIQGVFFVFFMSPVDPLVRLGRGRRHDFRGTPARGDAMRAMTWVPTVTAALLLSGSRVDAQHLAWDLEGRRNATCLYGTVTVLATHPAIYYCGANWHPGEPAGGYCGIQHNSEQERRMIFSIWDTSPQLHPRTTEADPDAVFGRFGGEGEGGHTHMRWAWKEGEPFQFFVHKQRGAEAATTDARYYIFDRDAGRWRHVATIRSPDGGQRSVATIGGGLNSFLENFLGRDKDLPKVALYRLWLGPSVDGMRPLTRAGGDGIWGQLHDSYFLAEGAPEKLDATFRGLEAKYGRPVFGREGRPLPPISATRVPGDVIKALKALPRAEEVRDKSDPPAPARSTSSAARFPGGRWRSRRAARGTDRRWSRTHRASRASHGGWRRTATPTGSSTPGPAWPSTPPDRARSRRRSRDRSPGQAWSFVKSGDAYHIRSRGSGAVLDVSGGSTRDGTAIITYPSKELPSPNQQWILIEVKK